MKDELADGEECVVYPRIGKAKLESIGKAITYILMWRARPAKLAFMPSLAETQVQGEVEEAGRLLLCSLSCPLHLRPRPEQLVNDHHSASACEMIIHYKTVEVNTCR